jgi:hypothetical protein
VIATMRLGQISRGAESGRKEWSAFMKMTIFSSPDGMR